MNLQSTTASSSISAKNSSLHEGRTAALRDRMSRLASQHRACKHLVGTKSLINPRRGQQAWEYARSRDVTNVLVTSGLSPMMQALVGDTYDRIGRAIFAARGDGRMSQAQLYPKLLTAMSRDKRYRHIRILEELNLVTRHEGFVHLHLYLRSNPDGGTAEARKAARDMQCRAADTRYKLRRRQMRKTSLAAKPVQLPPVIKKAITRITNKAINDAAPWLKYLTTADRPELNQKASIPRIGRAEQIPRLRVFRAFDVVQIPHAP